MRRKLSLFILQGLEGPFVKSIWTNANQRRARMAAFAQTVSTCMSASVQTVRFSAIFIH